MLANRAARLTLVAFAIVAGVQGGVARGARLMGVDEVRDRIVEIDTTTGEVLDVVAGDDVRAEQIVWAPDESFAYLLAGQRDEVLVFDPTTERIIQRIAVRAPTHVVFHPTEPRAYVHGCGVVVLDTTTHEIVDSFPAWPANYLVLSQSGRWLYGVSEYDSFWVRDLWLSVFYDGFWFDIDPTWNSGYVGGAAAAFTSDALVLAAEEAVWTFDPESREMRRFPYRGAGMAFAMAPRSDVAIVVAHRDLARIDLNTGATLVQPLDQPLWASWSWNQGSQVFFSDDRTTVLMNQGDRLVARDTEALEVVWESGSLPDGYVRGSTDYGLTTANGAEVLLFPKPQWDRWYADAAGLVRDGSVTAELPGTRWRDVAWRGADRSFYALGENGLERVDPISAVRDHILADSRFIDIAVIGNAAFAVAHGDGGTLRAIDLDSGGLSEPLADIFYGYSDAVPLGFDPSGDRLFVASHSGLAIYEAATGELLEQLTQDEIGLPEGRLGPVRSLAVLDDGVAVLGFNEFDYRATVLVVDTEARQIVGEHQLAEYSDGIWVAREVSGDTALAATSEDFDRDEQKRPVVARISRAGLLQEWIGEGPIGVTALTSGGTPGLAFVGAPSGLRAVDVVTGEVLAEYQFAGNLNALASDVNTVYAAIDAEPSLVLFDARSGAPLGSMSVDAILSRVEVADGDAQHGDLLAPELPSLSPPSGMIVAASGERSDITVWFDDERRIWAVPGTMYDEKVAFGSSGVLYAGSRQYQRGNFLIALAPRTGALLAEIALDGAPGNILPTPDGELVFVETGFPSGGGLSVIDAATNRLVHELRPHGDWRRPVMTLDGAYIVALDGDALAVLDTRSAAVNRYPIEVPAIDVAATAAGVHYLGDDGRLYRVNLQTGALTARGEPIIKPRPASQLAGAVDELVAHVEGGCSAELVSADAWTGERRHTLASGSAAMFSTVFAAGDYAFAGYTSRVEVWDLSDGHLVSRFVRPEGFDGGNLVWSIAAGCLDNCPAPPAAPERVRWDLLPSATPTATLPPTATPTPRPDPPVRQPGVWLEVDTARRCRSGGRSRDPSRLPPRQTCRPDGISTRPLAARGRAAERVAPRRARLRLHRLSVRCT